MTRGIITDSALKLAETFNYEKSHSEQVRFLSLLIFDGLMSLHNMGEKERELLEASAILHDIGTGISGDKPHNKFARDIIMNSEILCFASKDDRLITAQAARYHRGSLPREYHKYAHALPEHQVQTALKIASVLRLADGLDRAHSSAIKGVDFGIYPEKVILTIKNSVFSPQDFAGGEEKSDLFKQTFSRQLYINWDPRGGN